MFVMTMNDPLFNWILLVGGFTFAISIIREIRYRRTLKERALLQDQNSQNEKYR